ncbi:MAG: trehalose-phosphatase, partial [Acetobacteraceae bacterium]
REALAALSKRFGLVGCVSGRRAAEARRLVGLGDIAYAGNHGLELILPGETEASPDPSLAGREHQAAEFMAGIDATPLAAAGLRPEDKGPIQALHWRGAEDETGAESRAREIAIAAGKAGLEPRWGRKVLELRPVGGGGKDAAVASLLAGDGLDRAVYAGDDRTDLAALFRLALEKGPAGRYWHGIEGEGIRFREIAEAVGSRLGVPAVSIPADVLMLPGYFGFLANLVTLDLPASNAITRQALGWAPAQPGLLADLDNGHYFSSPAELL